MGAPTIKAWLAPARMASPRPIAAPPAAPKTLNAATLSASIPAGLPARTSLRAIRSRMPTGVIRRAMSPSDPSMGTRVRSPKGFESSFPRRFTTSGTCAWGISTALRRSARTAWMATTAKATAPKVAVSPSERYRLDIEPDHLSRPDSTYGHQDHSADEHPQADTRGPEQLHVAGIDPEQIRRDEERHEDQDLHGHPPFRRQHAHLAADLFPLPHGVGQGVEDLGKVPSHLPLNVDREDGPLELLGPHAFGKSGQGLIEGAAQPDLRHHPGELMRRWLTDLLRNGVQRLQEAVAGPHGARQDHQDIRQLIVEETHPFLHLPGKDRVRNPGRDAPDHEGSQDVAKDESRQEEPAQAREDSRGDHLARGHGQPGPLQLPVER